MKYLFTLIFPFFAILSVSLYSAQRPPNNPSDIYNFSGYDLRVDWRSLFRDRSQLNAILKNIPLSIRNKPRIYTECSVFINSLGLETIIDALIDYAAINDPADLDLFCQHTDIQLSEDQMQEYRDRLRILNTVEGQMFNALRAVDYNTLRHFLEQSARVNAKNKYGRTILMHAARKNHAECVRLLLEHPSIDINAQDKHGYTALIHAVGCDHAECVRLLLEHPSIDVNAQDKYGCAALMYAARDSHAECVRLLLEHPSIDVNAKNKYGRAALMYAVCNDKTESVRLLLEHPSIDVNIQEEDGWTALIYAVAYDHIECVRLLLEHPNIDINIQEKDGWTALIYAQKIQHIACEELLLKCQASDNENTRNLCTVCTLL